MTTFRLKIEYDGAAFSGWQAQPGGVRTVQGSLEEALAVLLRQRVPIQGAARTDAGVHAFGQMASFDAETQLEPDRVRRSLNALAGPDVAAIEVSIAPTRFNARFDSIGKHYRYQILSRPSPSPLLSRMCRHVEHRLDLEIMREAARKMVGSHDFAGFRSSDCERENTICDIFDIRIEMDDRDMIVIDVKGRSFLKNMVRIIVGTLAEIGRGRLSIDAVSRAIEERDRRLAGPTAPACGLALVEVFYPEGWIKDRPPK